MNYLDALESESIFIFREVASSFERPVLLYSVGKDSSVLLHLAKKAFAPGPIPFPLLHVDTGFKFPEMYKFRDNILSKKDVEIIVYRNEEAIAAGTNPYDRGIQACCGLLKTQALLNALKKYSVDAAIGGARREEEKSRAKERIFSVRDRHGQWDPRKQRPELWSLFNTKIHDGESVRIFPLSNWTELDIWKYVDRERIPVVPLYFSAEREVIEDGDRLIPFEGTLGKSFAKKMSKVRCRYRTLGCTPCTGAVRSEANNVQEIIAELEASNISERVTRLIDHDVSFSMEKKKKEGYF